MPFGDIVIDAGLSVRKTERDRRLITEIDSIQDVLEVALSKIGVP